jgi:hypothetical protein
MLFLKVSADDGSDGYGFHDRWDMESAKMLIVL